MFIKYCGGVKYQYILYMLQRTENKDESFLKFALRTRRNLTTKEPRMSDSRFLHTGRRISMQLKFRTAAGALAQARAD